MKTNIHELPVRKNPDSSYVIDLLDSGKKYSNLNLLRHIHKDSLILRMSEHIAYECDMPASTVFMVGLGIFSQLAMLNYKVEYQDRGDIPLGLYCMAEQPPGMSKTRCMAYFENPIRKVALSVINKLEDDLKEIESDEMATSQDKKPLIDKIVSLKSSLFISNATPEALDFVLSSNCGNAGLASSEQGLPDSLFGGMYKDKGSPNNNDVALQGFNGGFVSAHRTKRDAYFGRVSLSIVTFAQTGMIEKLLQSSNGSGLADRFFMLAEKHTLGTRDHEKQRFTANPVFIDYFNKCQSLSRGFESTKSLDEANSLSISDDAWNIIYRYRNSIEYSLADGNIYSSECLRGAAAKVDIQIMKIAALLHILDSECFVVSTISDKHVLSAINIVAELLESARILSEVNGDSGDKAIYEVFIRKMSEKGKPMTKRELQQLVCSVKPLKGSGNAPKTFKAALLRLIDANVVIESFNAVGGKNVAFYSLG